MTFPGLATTFSPQVEQQVVALLGQNRLVVEWA
jgi:hypothetical protein